MTVVRQTSQFEALLDYLKRARSFDFSAYKRTTLQRRIEKRMEVVNVHGFANYVDYLEVQPEEFAHLFNTILINVTAFFRDPAAWEYLANDVLPGILAAKPKGEAVRVWSAGCASGEEACTLAMILAEALGPEEYRERAKIYATDVDDQDLAIARQATYSEKQVEEVPPALREKYFQRTGDKYVFSRDLRRNIIFGRNDLIQDAPISRIDILTCRNTLMYFHSEAQARILTRFHFALTDAGCLLLGKAEMLLTHQHMFLPLDLKRRVFSKVPNRSQRDRLLVMAQESNAEGGPPGIDDGRLRDVAFDLDPVAQMVVDRAGTLVFANERARALFALNHKDIGRLFQDLEVSYRPLEVRSWIEQSYGERRAMVIRDVEWPGNNGVESQYFDVTVVPLLEHGNVLGVKVSFSNVSRTRKLQEDLQHSKQELETAYEELQTTNEELQSTVEELETTNEELQSTNEEMETMNEELQSTNEELQTINSELRDRSDELNNTNSFLTSILSSVNTGVIVLDKELRVQQWNAKSTDLWGVRKDEAVGKHFLNLEMGLPAEPLKQAIKACLNGDKENEDVKVNATNRRGKPISVTVTVTQLRGVDSDVRGVILLVNE